MRNIIGLVYDFDGTLSPKSMQEYTILPNLGVKDTGAFWDKVSKEVKETGAENTLVWMRRIKELAEDERKPITRAYFKKCGQDIRYFSGVEQFFKTINTYVKKASGGKMRVRHYIVSAGLKEILDGISIRKEFHNIFGSEYYYDYSGRPNFPKVVITDTIKTQYLFRINKGKENIADSINEHMPEMDRPIPFENIIYVGDGLTDVPAMTLTKKSGGHSIAVYRPRHQKGLATCKRLLTANRVDFIAHADYRKTSEL
ncbi:MAG: haloacid dehalogenase-like hydrolase, partial [Candidatus Omnitrophica bacterium]|nr:haloacid dehalogenase-like hydrolase [Candidatus Omnitrophota bacterium]